MPLAVVAAVLSGVTVYVLRLRGDVSLAGPSAAAQILEVMAGGALIVIGGIADRNSDRWLLPAAGAAWLVTEWDSPAAPGPVAMTVGLTVIMAVPPLVLASRWRLPLSTARVSARRRASTTLPAASLALAVLLATAAAIISGPAAAAAASPRDAGCTDCGGDLIAVARDLALNARLSRTGDQLAIACGLISAIWIAATLLSARHRRVRPSTDLTADAAAAVFAMAVAAGAAAVLAGGSADPQSYTWRAAAGGALLVLAVAVALPALRAARARRIVASAAAAIADKHGDETVGAVGALAAALGDGALRVAYAMPDGTWRDASGDLVTLPGTGVTTVTDGGGVIAALIHGRAARIDHASVTGAVSAARLLLDSERLEAGMLARVNDLRAARQQVVEAADAARSKLERDLHDGAQQRLVALRYALGLATSRAQRQCQPALAASLADADLAAERALADLRGLAHGISGATLPVEGLASAIRGVAEQARCAVTIPELLGERLPPSIEQAVYRFVADCVRAIERPPVSNLSIAVRRSGQQVIAELEFDRADTGPDWQATYLADRIAAAGGNLQLTEDNGRHQLRAYLPCE
jgi:signal transduction histidine kinase